MIHISKMTGKLEGFQSISTNTSTNEYCKKQNTKNDPDNICTHCYSWTMLKTFRKNMAPALERNSILLNSKILHPDALPIINQAFFRFNSHGELALDKKKGFKPAIRLNGTSDIDWNIHGLYNEFPKVKFYDYTKIYKRAFKYVNGEYPKNYHLTYSLNEDNKQQALDILKRGGNISAVFRSKKLPKRFLNYKVFNGDKSDLRFNDPKNVIIGLYAKGRALKDNTGFVQDV